MPNPPIRPSGDRSSELHPPSLDAVHAGTLALMTCLIEQLEAQKLEARASPDAPVLQALRQKIASNLDVLRQHPDLGATLSLVVARLHERWRDGACCDAQGCRKAAPGVPLDGPPIGPGRWH
jgi:hypothetical protein